MIEAAIKSMKMHTMSSESFLEEAGIMKQFNHPNLVKLYGVCSREEPLYIVTEYMKNGALESYLRGTEGQKLVHRQLVDISAQVSCFSFIVEFFSLISSSVNIFYLEF